MGRVGRRCCADAQSLRTGRNGERTMATASDPGPSQSLSSLHATAEPRRVGKQLWSLKYYHHYHRLRSRLAQLYHRQSSALTNPFPEMLAGRGIQAFMLVGVSSEDGVGELARNACRRSPEPCTLITVGGSAWTKHPPGSRPWTRKQRPRRWRPLQIALTDRSAIIIGLAATGLVPLDVCLGAKLVVLTDIDEKSLPTLAAKLDATPSWKRASLTTSAGEFGIVAWEANN